MNRIRQWLMHWWSRFGTIHKDVHLREDEIARLETRAKHALEELERQKRNARLDAEARAMIQERRGFDRGH